ncbi:MAG: aminoglycoside phosphotransferase family protein [Oscillospiraceae bacterium]|jgi:RIO-like serine/threonine protein kinase|nr:aminoglycoside phosphotransferase family protein [Oscillospiraceae bacterium]
MFNFDEVGDKIYGGAHTALYRSGDRAYKVFSSGYEEEAAREFACHELAVQAGLNVPELYGSGRNTEGLAVIAREFIDGRTFAEIIAEEPESYDEFLELLIDEQIKINDCDGTGAPPLKQVIEAQIRSLRGLPAARQDELLTELEALPVHNKLCHGNFGLENIIVAEDESFYPIDWALAMCGNASADVAKTYLKLCCISTETAENYIKVYSEKSNTDKQYVRRWIPIMAASRLADSDELTHIERNLMQIWIQ